MNPSAVFILGCQRSGTTMLQGILAAAPGCRGYGEGDDAAMRDYRLRELQIIQPLIAAKGLAIFKPICDSHYGDEILKLYPCSKILWIYRSYHDVVNSGMRAWPGHFREILERFNARDLDWLGWRSERLEAPQLEELGSLWRPDLSEHEAGAVFWHLRNSFYFTTGLVD